jgi:hypothetical protein
MLSRLLLLALTFLIGCSLKRTTTGSAVPSDVLPSMTTPQGAIGCQKMMDDYCTFLYSPDALGNLQIKQATEDIKVLQGDTENDFSQVYFRYARAKLNHKEALPMDLLQALKPSDYFSQLKRSLSRRPRHLMTLDERMEAERMDALLDTAWSTAMNEATWTRLARKFPGAYQLSERQMPPEYEIEYKKIRRVLISEVSKALWRNDLNWRNVEETFSKLQKIFVDLIEKMDMDPVIRQSWKERIEHVKLALPSSLPEIADDECASTTINAYYYKYLDVITVCAGDFNSEDILLTLAHEMSHALDISRTLYLDKVNSELGVAQKDLRNRVCNADTSSPVFSCDKWASFKTGFDHRLAQMGNVQIDLPEFNRCLKRKPTSKKPSSEDLDRISRTFTINRYSNLASNGYFLRITKKRMPLRNGHLNENPYYLDPCRYYLWSQGEEPPEEELSSLIYFTAEYRCSDPDDPDRFRKAIEVSKNMTEKMVHTVLSMEGEFSSWDIMERDGYSSAPNERFADVLGSHAMSAFLKDFPHISDRRARFLTGSSWQCSEPSLMSRYPEESRVENEYTFAHHSEGLERRREILSEPVREVLTCEKDFEFNECPLPLRKITKN